jgi:hypothetical protein
MANDTYYTDFKNFPTSTADAINESYGVSGDDEYADTVWLNAEDSSQEREQTLATLNATRTNLMRVGLPGFMVNNPAPAPTPMPEALQRPDVAVSPQMDAMKQQMARQRMMELAQMRAKAAGGAGLLVDMP